MIMWRIQLQKKIWDKKCVYGTRLAKNPIRLLHESTTTTCSNMFQLG